ncbi:MAG: DUF4268 domain-containing protein [wastewater metagenome]|nr:DUF4268 domain-containing protein [Candidatus Loosdrechtia aerotolerans]
MLFAIDPVGKKATAVETASLADLGLRERHDLQEWVLSNPTILGEDLFIITDEFSRFDRTRERLDLLALDRQGKVVIVELKRSAVGSHAELQAIRYAAYCSTMTLQDLAEIHAEFRARRNVAITAEAAAEAMREFVEDPDFVEVDSKPRIVLGAETFPAEITASVLWLRECDIDIKCIRLRPHRVGEHLLLDASILIPLPEAESFIIRREKKEAKLERQAREAANSEEIQDLYGKIIEQAANHPAFRRKAPPKSSALYYRNIGRRSYLAAIRRAGEMRIELYIDEAEKEFNRNLLAALEEQRSKIEIDLGVNLVWDGSGNTRKCAILLSREPQADDTIEDVAAWAATWLTRFYDVFAPLYERAIRRAREIAGEELGPESGLASLS